MPWPFDREYMQLALAAGLVVGVCAPVIGSFLVQRRLALMGDGIGHVAFAGVAGGLVVGIRPLWTALGASVAAAVAMDALHRRGRSAPDVVLALFFYSGIAGGVVLSGAAGALDSGLFSYLFGSILTVDRTELVTVAALGAFVVGVVAVARHALFAVVLDEEWSTVAGLPSRALGTTLAVLAAVTVVASMRVVGLLLVAALMALPVACAQLAARSFRSTIAWSIGIGMVSVVAGLAAARIWGLAPGGTIVLTCAACYVVMSAAVRGRSR